MIAIYSTRQGLAYQYKRSRTLVSEKGSYQFQKKDGEIWRNGRNSYAEQTVKKVIAHLKGA